MSRTACCVALAAAVLACDPPQEKGVVGAVGSSSSGLPFASASATIPPSPLASAPPGDHDADAEGHTEAAAAEPIAPERELRPDTEATHELAGVTLQATWRLRDAASPPKGPEVSADGIAKAAKQTALTWQVELAENGRMRIVFTTRALPLPMHAEIRARDDRFGSIIVWPSSVAYRVVPPGALRTVIGERRVDVTPLSAGVAKPAGDGKRFGVSYRRVEITSPIGSVTLELAKVPEADAGGPLFCRALVELAGIDPRTPVCQAGEVALAATYTWQEGGGIGLEVTSITKRTDIAPGDVLVPPPSAVFQASGLPPAGGGVFLTRDELAAFRTAALPLPPTKDVTVPGEGFLAVNRGDTLMYVSIDGVPTAAVAPGSEQYVIGPPRGRYVAQWRTFLGDRIEAPRPIEMPARLVFGGAAPIVDAGAPDAK